MKIFENKEYKKTIALALQQKNNDVRVMAVDEITGQEIAILLVINDTGIHLSHHADNALEKSGYKTDFQFDENGAIKRIYVNT